jgi:hypothetical protein
MGGLDKPTSTSWRPIRYRTRTSTAAGEGERVNCNAGPSFCSRGSLTNRMRPGRGWWLRDGSARGSTSRRQTPRGCCKLGESGPMWFVEHHTRVAQYLRANTHRVHLVQRPNADVLHVSPVPVMFPPQRPATASSGRLVGPGFAYPLFV